MAYLKIDIGCGSNKREGFIGLDYVKAPGVDYVLDLTRDPFPFDNESVDYVFSSHFLEHIREPNNVFQEIGRVCCDKATIEFWTPYAFTNQAFLYGHVAFLTEEPWIHFCYLYRDEFFGMLGGRWLLKNINYVVSPEVEVELREKGFTIGFALKYFKSVAQEFGVEIEFRKERDVPAIMPKRTFSHSRDGQRFDII